MRSTFSAIATASSHSMLACATMQAILGESTKPWILLAERQWRTTPSIVTQCNIVTLKRKRLKKRRKIERSACGCETDFLENGENSMKSVKFCHLKSFSMETICGDYHVLFAFCNMLLDWHERRWRMKHSLFYAQIAAKTANLVFHSVVQVRRGLEISIFKCVPHVQHDYFFPHSTNHISNLLL